MDFALNSLQESISLAGPHGISWDRFKFEISRVMKLKTEQLEWPPRQALKYILDVYLSEDDFKIDSNDLRFYCSNPQTRQFHLFQGRPIQLSESSLQALEVIASHGRNGVTQAELAKILGCDSKNAFHWIKSLIANDLIVRTPVASKKSFTYLLTLTRYLDEEISFTSATSSSTAQHTPLLISSKEIRQMIVDILAKAPGQTMVSKDVFAQTGLDPFLIKHFRRAATKLNEIGWLEYLFEDQLVGPYCRLFRLKRNPAEGLDLNSFLASQSKQSQQEKNNPSNDDQFKTPRGHQYHPDHPIIHQLILLLARAYPEPLTTDQLSHSLNISRKYLYKLIERILPAKKVGVIGAEGVEKVSDFVGKEKRLRLFIKSEEWRDYYVNLFTSTVDRLEFPLSFPASRPSTPTTTTSTTSNTQSPSDTRTRQLRHQALLSELSARKVLEIGKELCHRLQEILGDKRFTLDVKTLRRSVEILEREGLLRVVIATVPHGTRTLLIPPDLSVNDEIVSNYIAKLNEPVRILPPSAASQKLIRLKESMQQQPEFFVEGSLPLGIPQNPSVQIRALNQFGFLHGLMSRAQLFHHFLLSKQQNFTFETIPTIFDQLPLNLYIKLIGIVRISRGLFDSLKELDSTALQNLPEIYRDELSFNRKRFQSQISILLGTLEQLKLIEGQEQFSSLNFRLPLMYNLAKDVPLYNHKGKVEKIVKFTEGNLEASFNEFWMGMRQICTNYHTKHTSIYESIEDETTLVELPKPVLLARHPDAWKQRPSREGALERAVKKLASDSLSGKSKKPRVAQTEMSTKIDSLAEEFEVPVERVKQMYENYLRLMGERETVERLDKRDADEEFSEESDDSDVSSDLFTRWTPSDWTKLSLAFCILLQPPFLPANPQAASAGIKWHLATKIFDKPKSSLIIRRHGLKLFKSYQELRRMLELDTIVSLVMRQETDLTDSSDSFKIVFDSCQQFINNEHEDEDDEEDSFDLFDAFKVSSPLFTTLPSRQDHFLDAIDTWVQTRSFRHGLFLNDPGLVVNTDKDREKRDEDSTLLTLKQILISSTTEHFDYDSTLSLIKSIDPETLSSALNRLMETGFAAKNRAKDKMRLFTFPVAISESIREIIEWDNENFIDSSSDRFIVDCNTESLSISHINDLINSSLSGTTEIIIPTTVSRGIKFDTPVEIKLTPRAKSNNFNLSKLINHKSAIWFTPTHPQEFLNSVAIGCLNHLESSIKSQPGISIENLRNRYRKLFGDSGCCFDLLIEILVESHRIDIIDSKYVE